MRRDLAGHDVVASLIVLPRDTTSPNPVEEVLKWSTFARAHTLCPLLALVVTKTNTKEPTTLSDVAFERVTLNALRAAQAEQIFYTDAQTVPTSALTSWLLDVLASVDTEGRARQDDADPLDAQCVTLDLPAGPHTLLRERPAQQRTCDTCTLM